MFCAATGSAIVAATININNFVLITDKIISFFGVKVIKIIPN
jgi:hypothetical protein